MANADTPFGLKPLRHRHGAPYNGAANPYYKKSDYSVAVFVGDVVTKNGTANLAAVSAPGLGDFIIGSLPEIQRTTAGVRNSDAECPTGVVVGFGANPNDLSKAYSPADTEAVVWVCDDPTVIFEAQSPDALASTSMGLCAILLETHSGSTATGLSGVEIDGGGGTSPDASAAMQVTILRQSNRVGNEGAAVHNKIEVALNGHTESFGMGTNAEGQMGF